MRIEATLDLGEAETLFDILHHEITEHTCLAKLKYLSGEISKSQMAWHTGHAQYLEDIKAKLLAKHIEETAHLRPQRRKKVNP